MSEVNQGSAVDTFNGDNKHLISCIKSLLSLDEKGALVPHGIGGHARDLLSSSAQRLADFDRVTAERDAERRRADVAVADANAADAAGNKVSELLSNRTAERDALQALLTAADERADEDDMVLRSSVPERHKGCTSPVGAVQSYIVELEGRADLLEALLRDARQYHGVTLLTDPPQDAWKYHRISERIDALLKPEEPKEGPHLVLDIYGLGISAAEFMEALNITYQLAVPQSMTDTWWFFNCENVREISRLKVMTVTVQQCVGWGLSQHMADEIKARCKLPLKPVNLDVSFKPGTGGNHD